MILIKLKNYNGNEKWNSQNFFPVKDLKNAYPEVSFISGKRFSGRYREKDLLDWVG